MTSASPGRGPAWRRSPPSRCGPGPAEVARVEAELEPAVGPAGPDREPVEARAPRIVEALHRLGGEEHGALRGARCRGGGAAWRGDRRSGGSSRRRPRRRSAPPAEKVSMSPCSTVRRPGPCTRRRSGGRTSRPPRPRSRRGRSPPCPRSGCPSPARTRPPRRRHRGRPGNRSRWPRATRSRPTMASDPLWYGNGRSRASSRSKGEDFVRRVVGVAPRDAAVEVPGPLPVGLGERVLRRGRGQGEDERAEQGVGLVGRRRHERGGPGELGVELVERQLNAVRVARERRAPAGRLPRARRRRPARPARRRRAASGSGPWAAALPHGRAAQTAGPVWPRRWWRSPR